MRAPLIAIVFLSSGGAVCAQSANAGPTGLESCFQSARAADAVCSDPANDAVARLDCLQKAHTTLLACLEQFPRDTTVGSSPPEKALAAGAPQTAPATAAPEPAFGAVSPEPPAAAVPPDMPTATVSPDRAAPVPPDALP